MSKVAFSSSMVSALIIVFGFPLAADAQLFGNRTPGSSAPVHQIRSPFGNGGQRASLGAPASLGPANSSAAPGGSRW